MIINPDKFRHRVGVYLRPQTPNAEGGIDYTDGLITTVWADISPVKGSSYLYRQNLNETSTHLITIRYINFLTSENWLRYIPESFRTNLSHTNDPLITVTLFRILRVKNIFQLDRFQELECEEYNQT